MGALGTDNANGTLLVIMICLQRILMTVEAGTPKTGDRLFYSAREITVLFQSAGIGL